jgi:hypothetical protein
MATFYNQNYGTYMAPDAKKIRCANCGSWNMLYRGDRPPATCQRCKCDPQTGEEPNLSEVFHNDLAGENVRPTTHVQMSWSCDECGHYGIMWMKKKPKPGENKRECPNCSSTRIRLQKLPASGRSRSLWSPANPTKPVVRNNVFHCGHCGFQKHFRLIRPTRCENCGAKFK